MNKPLLSVCLITYNHVSFIRQAIEGVIMQKVDFKWELIIADDCSTDGTREVLLEYQRQYPEEVRLLLQGKNVGPAKNWFDLMAKPLGKYIAYFEGDDYWSDQYKLQKQIDFLETHPAYVGCFHNAEERYIDEDYKASYLYCSIPMAKNISFLELSYGNLIPTCSAVYRSNLFGDFPEWLYKLKMGDWPLNLLNAQFGDFWYMPQVMGVHRLHSKSTWMLQDAEKNRKYTIDAYDAMIAGFSEKKALADQLVIAREAFIRSGDLPHQKTGFKQKAKGLMTKIIDKL